MNWDKFSPLFDESWHAKMKPFIESEECDKIYDFLKNEAKRGKKIAPLSSNTFRAFKVTPLTNLKVVIVGMCPYHTFIKGQPVADGLAMSCSLTDKKQPTLEKFYEAIEKEVYNGMCISCLKPSSLIHLATQGVLLLNAALTTEMNKAGSHMQLWEPFMKYFFEEVMVVEDAPIVFLGKEAAKMEKYVAPFKWSFTLSHPASAAYKNTDWDSEGVFNKIDKILLDSNNSKISWLQEFDY